MWNLLTTFTWGDIIFTLVNCSLVNALNNNTSSNIDLPGVPISGGTGIISSGLNCIIKIDAANAYIAFTGG